MDTPVSLFESQIRHQHNRVAQVVHQAGTLVTAGRKGINGSDILYYIKVSEAFH
jgi:hypothetical protein